MVTLMTIMYKKKYDSGYGMKQLSITISVSNMNVTGLRLMDKFHKESFHFYCSILEIELFRQISLHTNLNKTGR